VNRRFWSRWGNLLLLTSFLDALNTLLVTSERICFKLSFTRTTACLSRLTGRLGESTTNKTDGRVCCNWSSSTCNLAFPVFVRVCSRKKYLKSPSADTRHSTRDYCIKSPASLKIYRQWSENKACIQKRRLLTHLTRVYRYSFISSYKCPERKHTAGVIPTEQTVRANTATRYSLSRQQNSNSQAIFYSGHKNSFYH